MNRFRLRDDEFGLRLDKIVQTRLKISRKSARQLIVAGSVHVQGRPLRVLAKSFQRAVEFEIDDSALRSSARADHSAAKVPGLLHREQGLAVVDKPTGLLSEGGEHAGPSVEGWAKRTISPKARLVHRLDAPTSGVMLIALGAVMAAKLGDVFRQARVEKSYLALVGGCMSNQEINEPIGRRQGTAHAVMKGGKASATRVRRLICGDAFSLVEATPKTGRTHQIRVHCSHVGHPLAGDARYGGARVMQSAGRHEVVPRCMLHAWRITLPEDLGLQKHSFEARLPNDFCASLDSALSGWRSSLKTE